MIKKLTLAVVCAAAFIAASTHAATGVFGGYIVLNINGAGSQFRKLENPADTTTPTYGGSLGTFNPAVNSLFLNGGEADTFKNGSSNVTAAFLNYRIYSGAATGSFTSLNLPFNSDLGNGDQKWQLTSANTNLLTGLPNGIYTLEVYVNSTTSSDGDQFLNAGGANYKATFTVAAVPEPGTISLLAGPAILGAWFFARRRRA